MRKIFIICSVLLLLGQTPVTAKDIIFLSLRCERMDKKPILPDKSKAPVRMPEICLDGTTLSFQPYHPEYIINIVQDGEVVFASVVPADATQFELPDYISGECIIQFMIGDYCFWGETEL